MQVDRREFFKILSAGAVTMSSISTVQARTATALPPDAEGVLYDATLCIGCKSCEVACKRNNSMPMDHDSYEKDLGVDGVWDAPKDLNAKTLNKIQVYRNGKANTRNQEVDGFSFVRRACMHCADPDCASACPTTAFTKDEKTGIVAWDKDRCCGCRYCQIACPYNIPKFEYDKAIPLVHKCEMCSHVQAEGGIPGCAEFCPTGATIHGKFTDILEEAKRRIALQEGAEYPYPVSSLKGVFRRTSDKDGSFIQDEPQDNSFIQRRPVAKYIDYIYGQSESGGAQYLMLSAVPFEKLGLPKPGFSSAAARSENISHTLYKGMIAPIALLGGLVFAAHRSSKSLESEGEVDHE
ncbi:MAG: hydrogenase 2 operon protein HybA [Candidatus Marinimicrobia bacterium]|nr:hydrogenase 2 operon protein HybA [Candidatus Neomarinimicrobiota bacterium]MCF7851386.1 hydrogenase 2 operon protein HybA [Candidatus Neomarinimicrobiota bacterium]